jgi:Zn-finger nucleic acid-binding protein
MLEAATVEGVAVDRCPRCGGIWFVPAELGALLKLDAAELRGFLADTCRLFEQLTGRTYTGPGLPA